MAETAAGGIDEPGVALPEGLVAKAEPLHRARPEIFHHNVGLCGQLDEELPTVGLLEVEGQAFLAPIEGDEVGAWPSYEGPHFAGLVTAGRLLHLDDIGPEVGEHHCGIGARQNAGTVEHPDTAQSSFHSYRPSLSRRAYDTSADWR